MASKINGYRASAARCEQRARETRNQADQEWYTSLARAFLVLAEAEAERGRLNVIRPDTRAALGNPAVSTNNANLIVGRADSSSKKD
jgi:hypothetical protein